MCLSSVLIHCQYHRCIFPFFVYVLTDMCGTVSQDVGDSNLDSSFSLNTVSYHPTCFKTWCHISRIPIPFLHKDRSSVIPIHAVSLRRVSNPGKVSIPIWSLVPRTPLPSSEESGSQ